MDAAQGGSPACEACGEPLRDSERGWYLAETGALSNTPSDDAVRVWHADCMVPDVLR